MLAQEVQTKWWQPAIRVVGWWISILNLLGSVGFLMSGAMGFAAFPKARGPVFLGSMVANFVGCWAFFVAAMLQWFEAVDKCPVVEVGRR